jgi:hypothetical protein
MTTYPDKNDLAEIDRALKDNGVTDPRARVQMIRDFSDHKYEPSQTDSYAVIVKDNLAKLDTGGDGAPDERADDVALIGKGGTREVKSTSNPWSANYRGKDAEAERIRLIKVMGTKAASQMAFAAGTDIAGRKLRGAAA